MLFTRSDLVNGLPIEGRQDRGRVPYRLGDFQRDRKKAPSFSGVETVRGTQRGEGGKKSTTNAKVTGEGGKGWQGPGVKRDERGYVRGTRKRWFGV